MFSKNDKDTPKVDKDSTKLEPQNNASPSPVKPSPPSLISKDLRIIGDLQSDGEIQIDGSVEGDTRSKTLLIGESAHLKGEITAESVVIHGTVNGQINARSVKLARTAHMVGDIFHEDLAIETGAFLEGLCKRIEKNPVTNGLINAATNEKTGQPPATFKAST
jgi:cytoskeletal protein CcmA (bactofilin family)